MTQADALIEVAASQLGVEESPKGSNKTKYGEAYGFNGVAWCMIFVWWCFREAGLSRLFYDGRKTASCTTLMMWAKANGQFVTSDYLPGDVLLYQFDEDDSAEHTGICVSCDGARVTAIEGNDGDKVAKVTRSVSTLHGAYRPAFDDDCGIVLPELRRGSVGTAVESMQILLEGNGYSCGRYGTDGDFGPDTEKALREYQQYRGLSADGVCGEKTWRRLLGV